MTVCFGGALKEVLQSQCGLSRWFPYFAYNFGLEGANWCKESQMISYYIILYNHLVSGC